MKKGIIPLILSLSISILSGCNSSKNICIVESCKNNVYKDNLCPDHYIEQKINTTDTLNNDIPSSENICIVRSCKNNIYKNNLCPDHYIEQKTNTTDTSSSSIRYTENICIIESCKNNVYKDNLCPDHYIEQKINTTDIPNNIQLTENETAQKSKKESIKKIKIGETINTKKYKFTLNNIELSYDVKPDNPPSYYSHYPAASGQVYIHIDIDIKNKQKQDMECDKIYTTLANFNNGYTYTGSAVVEDTDGDFTYANITSIDPLQKLGIHSLIDCPEKIETSKKPLFVILTFFDGKQYKYIIRD